MKTVELTAWDQSLPPVASSPPQRHYWPLGSALLLAAIPVATFDLVERNIFEVPLHLFLLAVYMSVGLHFLHAIYHWSQNRSIAWPLLSVALSFLPLTYLLLDADPFGYGLSDRFPGREETVFALHTRHYLLGCALIQVAAFLLSSAHQRGALSGLQPFCRFLLSTTRGEWIELHRIDPLYRTYGPLMWVEKPWSLPPHNAPASAPKVLTFSPTHALHLHSDTARTVRWLLSSIAIALVGVAIVNYWYTYPIQMFGHEFGSISPHSSAFSLMTVLAGLALLFSSAIVEDAR